MLRNYLIIAIRSLKKNKLTSAINIIGLSISVACSLIVFLFFDLQQHVDQFHENKHQIFNIQPVVENDNGRTLYGNSPVPLGPALKANFPQVTHMSRLSFRGAVLKYGEKIFDETIRFVDPDFLSMFSFPLLSGSKEVLANPTSIVMTEEMAIKYFADADPIGKEVIVKGPDSMSLTFVVSGILEDMPLRTSVEYDILLPYQQLERLGYLENWQDWKENTNITFIQFDEAASNIDFEKQLTPYLAIHKSANPDWPISDFHLESIATLSRNHAEVRNQFAGTTSAVGRTMMGLLAIFLLTLACFNFINIAIASAAKRMKEIGVRKVLGGRRNSLVLQFLVENMLLCFVAITLGLVLAELFFIPGFKMLFPLPIGLVYTEPWIWIYLSSLLLITGVGAGLYPAYYASAFKAVTILKGKQILKGRTVFTQVFLGAQFGLSLLTIFSGIVFFQNEQYSRDKDWGFRQQDVFVVPMSTAHQFTQYHDQLVQNTNLIQIAGTHHHIGRSRERLTLEILEKPYETFKFDVGFNYLQTMGIRLVEGRYFDEKYGTDLDQGVIVNQSFVKELGWEKPLNEYFTYDSTRYQVIGVVEDFNYDALFDPVRPVFIRLVPETAYQYLIAQVATGKEKEAASLLSTIWNDQNPTSPYTGESQLAVFDWFYREMHRIKSLMSFTALIALLVSCMGLFGLVSLVVVRNLKAYSIRKVLGANVWHLLKIMNQKFIWVIIVSSILFAPLCYWLLNLLLDNIQAYHADIGPWPLIISLLLLFLTAGLTISSQLYRVLRVNPTEFLRDE